VLAAKILRVSEMEKLFGVLRRRIGPRG